MPHVRRRLVAVAAAAVVLSSCAGPQAEQAPPTSAAPTAPPPISSAPSPPAEVVDVAAALRVVEERYDARVGVSLLDTGTGAAVSYRGAERFGFASTLKVFVAAEFLRRAGPDERQQVLRWTLADVERAGYSPVTSAATDTGLTALQLAEAAVRESDNTATNLVLERLGGPRVLDAALERLGDTTTEVVDEEPALNTIDPGSEANTTTADAFTAALATVRGADYATTSDRETLLDWMSGNATGDTLVRAGAPEGWVVADKSGGAGPIRNDIAVVTPPGRAPLLLTILTERNDPTAEYDDAVVSEAAEVVLQAARA